jgi:lipoprotein-anchoring transpeptidase ErfK/SrfK
MRIFIAVVMLLVLCTGSLCLSFAAELKPAGISFRYEVLVDSCQVRIIGIENGQSTVMGVIPAMTAKSDSRVRFNTEVPITSIKINPSWKPTPSMRKDPDDRLMKPVKGGQSGNPIGMIAFYLSDADKKMRFVRFHEAPEMPQRNLAMDENGNLKGFRESRGCVGLHRYDMIKLASGLTGQEAASIEALVAAKITCSLPLKYRATVIFLKE